MCLEEALMVAGNIYAHDAIYTLMFRTINPQIIPRSYYIDTDSSISYNDKISRAGSDPWPRKRPSRAGAGVCKTRSRSQRQSFHHSPHYEASDRPALRRLR